MLTKELITYIKNCRKQGFRDKRIKQALQERGWPEKEIKQAMARHFSSKRLPKWVFIATAALAVAVIVFTGWQAILALTGIHQISVDIAELTKQIIPTFKFIEPEPTEVVDCGEVGPDKLDPTGEKQNCFEAKFKECKPAKFVSSVDMGQLGGLITYYYEIMGLNDGLCSVKSKYIRNPNPDWIGKEMICKYDNSKDFEEAIKDMSKCEGELYNLMTGG